MAQGEESTDHKRLDPRTRQRLGNFCRHVGRAIERYDMIAPGEKVLVGVSGGKDSLCLAVALHERLKWIPVRYHLEALQIEWREQPLSAVERSAIAEFFDNLGIRYLRVEASMGGSDQEGCYFCARNRKRILFEHARRVGCRTVALGHHLDDFVETTLMNLCFQGQFATIMPVQEFFDGAVRVVRPLCEIEEQRLEDLARKLSLPVINGTCARSPTSMRAVAKEAINHLARHSRHVRHNIYRSPWHINHEYLPSSLAPERQ